MDSAAIRSLNLSRGISAVPRRAIVRARGQLRPAPSGRGERPGEHRPAGQLYDDEYHRHGERDGGGKAWRKEDDLCLKRSRLRR